MSWCETHGVEYVLGLAKNSRLTDIIAGELAKARGAYEANGEAARLFKGLSLSDSRELDL
jgi:hypothetical protein